MTITSKGLNNNFRDNESYFEIEKDKRRIMDIKEMKALI